MIDSNNFDFSQGDSCLRTELSWRIGLREHSIQLIQVFDQLLTSLKDENLLLTQIRSLRLLQNISIFEYNFLTVRRSSVHFLFISWNLDLERLYYRNYS